MKILDLEQNSPAWFEARAGLPTASAFSKLVTSTGAVSKQLNEYAAQLAAESLGDMDKWEGNQYTDRGHDLEPDATAWYSLVHGVDVETVGFCTDDAEQYGCSPDRLIGDNGLLEIKCLIGKNHILTASSKACPAKYKAQVQGQLLVTGREYCDLLFYHPILPSYVIHILPDQDFITALKQQIDAVIEKRDYYIGVMK